MKGKIGAAVITFILMALLFATITIVPMPVRGTTLYVGGTGAGNYTTIQAAVNAANPGDTVYVYGGTYQEIVTINKPLSIIGQDRDSTIIDGERAGDVIRVSADWVNITRFTVRNSGPDDYGIHANPASNITITDNAIIANDRGVKLLGSNNTLTYNNVSANNWGNIIISTSSNSTILGNFISSTSYAGIALEFSVSNMIADNVVTSADVGIYMSYGLRNNISSNNLIGNEWGLTTSEADDNIIVSNNISSNNHGGVGLEWSNNNLLIRNNISSNTDMGIHLVTSKSTSVSENIIADNLNGLWIDWSSFTTVKKNLMLNNGISIYGMANFCNIDLSNTVNGKPVYYWKNITGGTIPPGAGQVILANSTGVTIRDQRITHGSWGLALHDSSHNIITNVSLLSNAGGFYMTHSNNNTFTNNTIYDHLQGLQSWYSYNNSFHHNNIVSNEVQVYDHGANFWDDGYPSGGNYWSNYTGDDLFTGPAQDVPGSDGIGDVPLVIRGGTNRDSYPLMSPIGLGPPSAPRLLSASTDSSSILLSWSAPASDGGLPVTNHTISRGTTSDGETFLAEIGSQLNYTDSDIVLGQIYYYTVSARNAVGNSPDSEEAYAILATTPSEPLNLQATPGNGQVKLTWSAPAFNGGFPITNYTVYRGTTPGGETLLTTLGNVLSYVDTDVVNGQTYYYKVTARNSIGEGPKSPEASATPAPPTIEKSILEEMWFWALIIVVIIAIITILAFVIRRRKGKVQNIEEPSQSEEKS